VGPVALHSTGGFEGDLQAIPPRSSLSTRGNDLDLVVTCHS
jgi:hypothetical protein